MLRQVPLHDMDTTNVSDDRHGWLRLTSISIWLRDALVSKQAGEAVGASNGRQQGFDFYGDKARLRPGHKATSH